MRPHIVSTLVVAGSAVAFHAAVKCAYSQTVLPEITVTAPKEKPKTTAAPKKAKTGTTVPVTPTQSAPAESAFVTTTKSFDAAARKSAAQDRGEHLSDGS